MSVGLVFLCNLFAGLLYRYMSSIDDFFLSDIARDGLKQQFDRNSLVIFTVVYFERVSS